MKRVPTYKEADHFGDNLLDNLGIHFSFINYVHVVDGDARGLHV